MTPQTAPEIDSDILTYPQAAAMLNMSRSGVKYLVLTGRLTPAMKLPGKTGAYLFHRSDIEALKSA